MLKRIFAKVRPSPAMAVALLGVALGLGSTSWAANGGAFILGVINSATARTVLGADFNGSALQVNNTSTAASAVPLQLTAAPGHPPIKVNTATKVTNLNADYLDGIDSSTLTRVRRIPFTLAAGASTASIALPPGVPVHLMGGKSDGVGDNLSGFGVATLIAQTSEVWWIGSISYSGTPTYGASSTVGAIIVHLDYLSDVSVEVNGPGAIRVRNVGASTHSGEITLVW